jgi:hypothetical protein
MSENSPTNIIVNTVNPAPSPDNWCSSVYNMFNNYKTYIIIGICGLLILYMAYYFFLKKKDKPKEITKPLMPLPQKCNKSNDKDIIVPVQEPVLQQTRKLQHPKIDNDDDNNKNESSEVDYDLDNIKLDENHNIQSQNLTNSEVEDINNKLNMI